MGIFGAEVIGTALLILLGNGVVACVLLNLSKGQNSGWIVITFGWGMAVMVAVFAVGQFSGAHLNPAVTVGRIFSDTFAGIAPASVPGFVVAQLVGLGLAMALVSVLYPRAVAVPDAEADAVVPRLPG